MSVRLEPVVPAALEDLSRLCIQCFAAGQSDEQVVSALVENRGINREFATSWVRLTRKSVAEWAIPGGGSGSSEGKAGVGAASAPSPGAQLRQQRNPGRRLLIRVPCLLAGGFLVLASAGGFQKGEVATAVVVLGLGLALGSAFVFLRPASEG